MRVAYVITRSDVVGGAHVHVRELARHLLRAGHEVSVLVGGEGAFTEELLRLGVPVRSIRHLVRPLRPLQDLRGAVELIQALGQVKADLVSTHSSKAGWLGRLAAWRLGLPVIFTVHGWAFTEGVRERDRRVYIMAERLAAPLAKRIITVSEYDRRLALKYRVAPPHKIVTIHNGVPDIGPELLARPNINPPRIIMVARFEPPKDHVTLLKALSGLRHIPWTLEFVGDGPTRGLVERWAASLGLRDRIDVLGTRSDVDKRLAASQLFVLVSKWEGLPLSILEAMRAALPVIASDVGGVREAVVDGDTGFLVPRDDVDALRSRLAVLLENSDLRLRMGRAGRHHYKRNFTFEQMLSRTITVYWEVLSEAANWRRS